MPPEYFNPDSEWKWIQNTIHSSEYKKFSKMQKEILFEFQLMLNSIYALKNETEKQLLIEGYLKLKQVF